MTAVKAVESAIVKLSPEEQRAIRDWLDDLIEDHLEVSDAFKEKIERAEKEIAAGTYSRVRDPNVGK